MISIPANMDVPKEIAFRLDGKVALVTGAGRGIGLGIVSALAGAGCSVAIQDIDRSVAEEEAKKIVAAGGKAIALGGDINDLTLPATAVAETIESLGGLHILINNAAIQSRVHWLEESLESIEQLLRADLISPILFCQQAVRIFKKQKFGRIINLGSIQQLGGNPGMLPYSLSKAALVTLTKALARDLAKDGITVNLIAPGWIDTYRNRGDFLTPQEKIDKGKNVPVGRIGEPGDFAGTALLLCSDAGAYITGQSIHIDGGMSAR